MILWGETFISNVKEKYNKKENLNTNCELLESTNKEQLKMKYLTKRKDGRWQARKYINGQSYSFYGRTQLEANQKLRKFLNTKKITQTKKSNLTLKDWYLEWYKTFKEKFVSLKTSEDILRVTNLHLKELNHIDIGELTPEVLQKFLNKIKPSRTKEKLTTYLNACLDKATALGKIKINPFAGVVLDKKINKIRKAFTYEEQEKILERLEHEEIKPIIMIYLLTGLRKNELKPKRFFENINFESNLLKAENEKQRSNETVYKYIDLSKDFINYLKQNKKVIEKQKIEMVYRKFSEILKELKIQGSIHTLRHTFGTNHFYLGTPDKIYSSWLGHSTIKITKDIYTSLDRSITKEKIHKLYNNLYFEV